MFYLNIIETVETCRNLRKLSISNGYPAKFSVNSGNCSLKPKQDVKIETKPAKPKTLVWVYDHYKVVDRW